MPFTLFVVILSAWLLSRSMRKKKKPHGVSLTILFNDKRSPKMPDISLVIAVVKDGNVALKDNVTGLIVPATFSNQTVVSNSNPEFAEFTVNANNPNVINARGIAAGTGTVEISADATYTDPGDGVERSASFAITKTYEVVGTPHGVTFDVVFS